MPSKIESFDSDYRKRLMKIGEVLPLHLARARKYRSSSNWQNVVKIQKRDFPLCCDCFGDHKKEGGPVVMAQVHHVRELGKYFHLRAYKQNLRSICTSCHARVSQMERAGKPTYYLFKVMPDH